MPASPASMVPTGAMKSTSPFRCRGFHSASQCRRRSSPPWARDDVSERIVAELERLSDHGAFRTPAGVNVARRRPDGDAAPEGGEYPAVAKLDAAKAADTDVALAEGQAGWRSPLC